MVLNTPKDPTLRFSSRVQSYVKYRPNYPLAVIDILTSDCGLSSSSLVADVGSGTGLLSQLFLANGNLVFGVEPNREMREAGEAFLKRYSQFTSIAGRAEATTLGNHSVDLVVVGQAFHWFDCRKARQEFARILKLGGWVVLIWNVRRVSGTPFLEAYEQLLLAYAVDHAAVTDKHGDRGTVELFFGPGRFKTKTLQNVQQLNFEGLKGRLLSSSYIPEAGDPRYEAMLRALESIFHLHQVNGVVTLEYATTLYYGQLEP
jgi:SAM-dependent methyltransferase